MNCVWIFQVCLANLKLLKVEILEISTNPRTVGELIYGFFDYYSRFDYDNWAISIKDRRIFNRFSGGTTCELLIFKF